MVKNGPAVVAADAVWLDGAATLVKVLATSEKQCQSTEEDADDEMRSHSTTEDLERRHVEFLWIGPPSADTNLREEARGVSREQWRPTRCSLLIG